MKYRKLGLRGPKVSSVGLGCMTFTMSYGLSDEEAALQVIHKAHENGVTFFDTADAYGHGANEKLLGKAAKSFRKHVVIASKCGSRSIPTTFPILSITSPAISNNPAMRAWTASVWM